jgi:hypothetical protein
LRAPDPFLSERSIKPEMKMREGVQKVREGNTGLRRKRLVRKTPPFLVIGKCLFHRQSSSSKLAKDQLPFHTSLEASSSLTPLRSTHYSLNSFTPCHRLSSHLLPKAMSGYQSQLRSRKAPQPRNPFSNQSIDQFLARFDSRPKPFLQLP